MKEKLPLYIAVFCIAWATLAFELLQTRVLSALFYNNVVYLTVTIALMGFGISGVFVSILSRKLVNPEKLACVCMGFFALSSCVCLRVASFLPVISPQISSISKLVVGYAFLIIPFIFSGAALSLIFMAHGRDIYRLYFIDLTASALGALGFALFLRPCGADALIWVVSGVALCGSLIYGFRLRLPKLYSILLVPLFVLGFITWGFDLVNDRPVSYKYAGYLSDKAGATVERSQWTTIAKIDVWAEKGNEKKTITQDGDAPTTMPSRDFSQKNLLNQNNLGPTTVLQPQSLPYLIRSSPGDVLVIGSGGGQEMVIAKAFGTERITGVEINPATYEFLLGPYRDFVQWPNWENVTLYNAEGRHFISRTDTEFDIISMTGVDTLTALNTGAYVLAENYLYTVEAIEDYLNALKPDGVMYILRWLFLQPRESLRLANLYMSAAEQMGIENPSQCIMVLAWYFWPTNWTATIFKKEPFTQMEVETILHRIKDQKGFSAVYIPDVFPADDQQTIETEAFAYGFGDMEPARLAYNRLIRAESLKERSLFEKGYPYNITPVIDDRPFFFEYHKIAEIFRADEIKRFWSRGTIVHYILYFLFIATVLVAFLSMIVPLYLFEREGIKVEGIWSLLAFFCSLGLGFMFIELGLIQRLSIYLGHPMHTLAVGLAGILLFAGIGSYRAGSKKVNRTQLLKSGMIGTALSSVLWLVVMKYLIPLTLGWPIEVRIVLTLLSILPVGLFMGIPFATGLRYLEECYPRFIPWAWGINGLTSVMASILAVICAMRFGFTIVVLLGSLVYLLGLCAILYHLRKGLQIAQCSSE